MPLIDFPGPATVPIGPCHFHEMLARDVHAPFWQCDDLATRRVQIGNTRRFDVCLWHSLVARHRFDARLVLAWPRTGVGSRHAAECRMIRDHPTRKG